MELNLQTEKLHARNFKSILLIVLQNVAFTE